MGMPYRDKLLSSNPTNPEKLLSVWREERAYRISKTLCYSGLILAAIATIADAIWSPTIIVLTDLVILFSCLISLFWIKSRSRPAYFWWPIYWAFWVSILPSLFTTGGLNSPFFGVDLAALFAIGMVLDTREHAKYYLTFALAHIPAFYIIDLFYPLKQVELAVPFSGIIIAVTLAAVSICMLALLRTEQELSLEFAEHYRNLAKTENDLKQRETQLREAQSIARIGSWEWDLKADRISWSDELFHIFEVSRENFDPSFRAYLNRLHPERRDKIQKIIQHSIQTGEEFTFENFVQTSQGERYIFSRGRALQDSDGQTVRMLGTSQDITDRKHIESQLMQARNEMEKRVEERTLQLAQSLEREKAAKESAETATLAKMQFLANMSHEIRTPMNAILGFAELLSTSQHTPEESREYVARIRGNGAHLLHLIDDILDLSKFEAGRIPIHKSIFSVKSLVYNVVSSFGPMLHSKDLDLTWTYKASDNLKISSDAHRLSQILTNLLSNAIKFSDHGTIVLNVRSEEVVLTDKVRIFFDIEDTGIGISKENQKNLFQPFSQADSSIARKFGGSGLGLILSRRISQALGGNLELIKSAPNEGSHFQFHITVDRVPAESAEKITAENKILHQVDQAQFFDKKILLAEDSPDNAFLICHYIKSLGAHIDVAVDGLQAVMMSNEKSYDCILMDIQMPGMDGLEATKRIRAQGFKNPIIALTAHALPAEAARSLQAGCNLHLTKPINKAELIGALSEQLTFV